MVVELNRKRANRTHAGKAGRGSGPSPNQHGGPDDAALPRWEITPLADATAPPPLEGADEVFRGIYTRLGDAAFGVLAVSSAIAGEGKSTVALGLATTIAQDFPDREVVLVETDFQHPTLAGDFDLAPGPGLADCLRRGEPVKAARRSTQLENLSIVPAGDAGGSPSRLLRSGAMQVAVDSLRESSELVLLDVPAVLVNSDAQRVCALADGVLLVVRGGVTPAPLVEKAVDLVDESRVRGVVVNDARSAIPAWLTHLVGA